MRIEGERSDTIVFLELFERNPLEIIGLDLRLGMDTPLPVLVGFIRRLECSLNTRSTFPSSLSSCPFLPGGRSSPTSIGS